MSYGWPGSPWGSHITEARQPGAYLGAHVGSQSEGPGAARVTAPNQWILKGQQGRKGSQPSSSWLFLCRRWEEPPQGPAEPLMSALSQPSEGP